MEKGVSIFQNLLDDLYVVRAHANLFQYSCLENPMDRGAWRAIVQSTAKSQIH